MKTKHFRRKVFDVQAVKVTEKNRDKVAKWSNGALLEVTDTRGNRRKAIKIDVWNPRVLRHSYAYEGNWVVKSAQGFKIFTHTTFLKNFEEVHDG
ncbi:MAG: hypothetical protein ACRC8U_01220 [Brooklawnia sp.]